MKRIISFIMALFLMLGVCSCSDKTQNMMEYEADIYYADAGKNSLSAEKVKIKVNTIDQLYEAVLNKMLEDPVSQSHMRIIPKGTKLLGAELKASVLAVDFSKEIYVENESESILIRTAVLRTMTALSEINAVEFFVEGEKMKNTYGEEIGILNKEDIVFETELEIEEKKYIKLYFSDLKSEHLIAEAREITVSPKETMEMRIIKELLKGPVNPNLMKTIPSETKILSVETKEGICFVNFSQEFRTRHTGGSAGEMMTVYSIVNSLTEIDGVEKVQFLIEGQKKDVFIHLIFNEPFSRDQELIQK